MNRVFIAAVIGISLFCSCCVIPPMRVHRAPDERTISSIKEGVTTKEDVLLMLGEPDRVADDERYFQYRWSVVSGIMFGYLMYAGEDEHYLNITFDDNNVVKKCELTKNLRKY